MSVITISGNLGSGAIDIGRAVAKSLKFDYVDREILAEAARTLGVSMAAVANRDERTPHFRERLASFFGDFLERSAAAGATDPMMGTSSLEMLMATTYGEAAALPLQGGDHLDYKRPGGEGGRGDHRPRQPGDPQGQARLPARVHDGAVRSAGAAHRRARRDDEGGGGTPRP
jgi:hypothetical protein